MLVATRTSQVRHVLADAERAAEEGLVACGYLSYEAASAFDAALVTHPSSDLPLAWFAIFEPSAARPVEVFDPVEAPDPGSAWRASIDRRAYAEAISTIHDWIASGETYQVNYTLRLERRFRGDPLPYFHELVAGHGAGYGAWIDTGRHALCSLSPELFFHLEDERIVARPMKGTAARGRTGVEDREMTRELARYAKDRAENVMIVDMVRNDLGRIARPGSVEVSSLWDVETYPTLHQMTSTCTGRTDAPFGEIAAALFPSASITGAPKVRTMELIAEIEDSPRGIYTGAIGSIGPGRRATFNVAIRTVEIDREAETARYGVGSGIVWDSLAEREYDECLTKALVVTTPEPRFDLLETLRWEPETGYCRLERHLARLADSAAYFDRPVDLEAIRRHLDAVVLGPDVAQRVRLLLGPEGGVHIEAETIAASAEPRRLALARRPVDPADRFLFHKTTHRRIYDEAWDGIEDADDVLLFNTHGEITESTIANVVLELGGHQVTPPVSSGLLPGTHRAELLEAGLVVERVVSLTDLERATAISLVSSRGRFAARLVGVETPSRVTS